MSVPFHELIATEFQNLIGDLCYNLLGPATEKNASGPDGGVDARFIGIPAFHPDWNGKIIAQAKHTENPIASANDSKFWNQKAKNSTATMNVEVKKIKKLKDEDEVDYYILFTNRRLPAQLSRKLQRYISEGSGIDYNNILIVGIEKLSDYWKQYPDLHKKYKFPSINNEFVLEPSTLEYVVDAMAAALEDIEDIAELDESFNRIDIAKKNELNHLQEQHGKYIIENEIRYDKIIRDYFAHPGNIQTTKKYRLAAKELQRKIIEQSTKPDYDFYRILNYLHDSLYNRSDFLKSHQEATTALLYYMYYNCDIGVKETC